MRPRSRGASVVTSVAWEAYTACGLCVGGTWVKARIWGLVQTEVESLTWSRGVERPTRLSWGQDLVSLCPST